MKPIVPLIMKTILFITLGLLLTAYVSALALGVFMVTTR